VGPAGPRRHPAPGPFSYWDSARDVLALLDHLGIDQAVLGGMSQGGFLSLRAALLAPQRVRGLVLIDSQAGTDEEATRPGYEQLQQMWLDQGPGPVQEIVAAIILGPGRRDGWYAKWAGQYAPWAPGNLSRLTWPFRCLMDRDDITGRLGEVTCPARIVHGSQDAAIPLARVEKMRDGLGRPDHVYPDRRGSARLQRHPPRCRQRRDRELPARVGRLTGSRPSRTAATASYRAAWAGMHRIADYSPFRAQAVARSARRSASYGGCS
jgi:pimeloyl-ACP methyl ester carboxylesterase